MNQEAMAMVQRYCEKYLFMKKIEDEIVKSVHILENCYSQGGQVLICGNGGSCADADHIVGEMVKGFKLRRPLEKELFEAFQRNPETAELGTKLQGSLPAINLCAHTALVTAVLNDIGGEYIFAQQVAGYGRRGDVLIGISTSGNSDDVLKAINTAKVKGLKTIGMTGGNGGKMASLCDVVLRAESNIVEDIQDMHSSIYHALCAAVERCFWEE